MVPLGINMINLLIFMNFISAIFCAVLAMSSIECKCSFKNIAKLNIGIFLLAISSGIWSANMAAMLWFRDNIVLADFLGRLNWIGGFVVASFSFVSLAITKEYKKAMLIGAIQFLLALFFVIIAMTPLGIKRVISVYPLEREVGPLSTLFRFWILVSIIYCLYITIRYYIFAKGIEKLKFQYYTFGVTIYAVLGLIFNVVFPLIGNEKLVQLTSSGAVVWVLASFYSIHYYKLLDIEVIFCDALKYVIFIVLGLIIHYVLTGSFSELLSLSPFLSSTISLVIVGTIYFITPLRERINNTVRNIVLKKRTAYQKLLERTAEAVVEILDLEALLQYVLGQIRDSLGATKICIFLLDEETKDEQNRTVYRLAASYGMENLQTTYFRQYKIINWLKKYKEPLLLDVAYHTFEPEDYHELTTSLQLFGAIIIIPILYSEQLIGIITLDQKKVDGTVFDLEDIEILKTLSEQLAVAIHNSMTYKELHNAYLQITRALALTLESKDEYLIGHSDNVTKYAVMLAKKLGLSEREVYIVAQATMLHDLGKIGIHDYILNKPGKLTEKEWEEVKQHPIKGAKILEPLPFLGEVAKTVLYHHEHYDGSGYPEGLKGEQIPLLSRILTLADSVDAMLSERPYKERPMTIDEMLQEIILQKGKHFDPNLVDKFVEIVKEHPEMFAKR
ncbi:MAG: HD domain-containing protein [Endomicrobia bacterium]|nr:HD domain-containing protein [Endomicrobiia bacterium]